MKPKFICLHWTAGGYTSVSDRYHDCVQGNGKIIEMHPWDVQLTNHTGGHNTDTLGLAICCMSGGSPHGRWPVPPTQVQIEALAWLTARASALHGIMLDADHCFTHAEIAIRLGYGPGQTWERWDLHALVAADMERGNGGAILRRKARWYYQRITGLDWRRATKPQIIIAK